MKNTLIIVSLALCFFSYSCKKKTVSIGREYFIFGTQYGECSENCFNYFILIGDHLYPYDHKRPMILQTTKAEGLPSDKYKLADALEENFPQFLKDRPNSTFGCPDCRDQGEIQVEIREHGKIKKWRLDTDISENPKEIREFAEELMKVVSELRQ